MNDKNIIVGLDVGTTKVCTIVGLQHPNQELEIIGIGTHPSYGLKKGSVVNIDKTVRSIQNSLEEARLMAGVNIGSATIGIAGSHIYSFNSSGVVAIKGKEITQDDVDRVLEAAKAVVIPSDRDILHVIPQEFRVDNTTGIKNPIGMCGVRLEAHVHIVTGSIPLIQNLVKCVEQTGIDAEHITLQPLASSEAVLSYEEKELGVVLIDIGGGTTDIAVWKDGSLIHSQIIPIGGNHFTNDLAVALKIPHNEAERIKINHGSVLAEQLNQSAHITVQGMSGTKPREVQLSVIAEVLGARAEELFEVIRAMIDDKKLSEEIAGGFVLTGGGALIKGMPELGEYILMRSCKIGFPIPFGGMTNIMQNPKYSTVLGLLLEAAKRKPYVHVQGQASANNHRVTFKENEAQGSNSDLIGKLSESLKSVFKEIF
ncbi:cell division protein FtsA [Bacteriovorax stolpii]|uniref:Cell division protein FtsA n=1 Tax=Bacteriovorax stolpii TaxID=960 RepID=A0A2K9NM57_BACTC|nr:cell division protein FtsA [Bacteriovorax stolpii]AUN96589.1 cell division protein FtsA [Bacteriovorax stolpii]QDK43479.1 cell division protein FtsA [Bacteriovorax stolpii]TDP53890.1 cell division protein FtsA [Bacteriovorax stolpii]BDT26610.1 cell division protein FtsA [Bacteriovorax sp. HI3]